MFTGLLPSCDPGFLPADNPSPPALFHQVRTTFADTFKSTVCPLRVHGYDMDQIGHDYIGWNWIRGAGLNSHDRDRFDTDGGLIARKGHILV